jgi:hypothetical protein
MSMVTQMSFLMLTALTATASSAVPELKLAAPLAEERDGAMLGHHLFLESLRVPFGDDWGGETFMSTPLGRGLSLGLLMRAWNAGFCNHLTCTDRAVEAGVELRYRVKPGLDLGVGIGMQRAAGPQPVPTVMPRLRLRF